MPRNVEIKARVADFAPIVRALGALDAGAPVELSQEDTFFRCDRGRLKLRRFSAAAGELIAYVRPNATGPKESAYQRVPTAEPDLLGAEGGLHPGDRPERGAVTMAITGNAGEKET